MGLLSFQLHHFNTNEDRALINKKLPKELILRWDKELKAVLCTYWCWKWTYDILSAACWFGFKLHECKLSCDIGTVWNWQQIMTYNISAFIQNKSHSHLSMAVLNKSAIYMLVSFNIILFCNHANLSQCQCVPWADGTLYSPQFNAADMSLLNTYFEGVVNTTDRDFTTEPTTSVITLWCSH